MQSPWRRWLPALPYLVTACAAMVIGSASVSAGTPAVQRTRPSRAPQAVTADDVIRLILSRNPALKSYTAHAHLDIRQLNFPYLHPVLDGTMYYKSPGLIVSSFPHVPFYLKSVNFEQSAAYAATKFKQCYSVSVIEKGDHYFLHMEPYIHSRVKSLDVKVAKTDGAIQHMEWHYLQDPRDHIILDLHYSKVEGYDVVTAETTDIRVDHIRAIGLSLIDGFLFNVPVPTPTPPVAGHECSNLG